MSDSDCDCYWKRFKKGKLSKLLGGGAALHGCSAHTGPTPQNLKMKPIRRRCSTRWLHNRKRVQMLGCGWHLRGPHCVLPRHRNISIIWLISLRCSDAELPEQLMRNKLRSVLTCRFCVAVRGVYRRAGKHRTAHYRASVLIAAQMRLHICSSFPLEEAFAAEAVSCASSSPTSTSTPSLNLHLHLHPPAYTLQLRHPLPRCYPLIPPATSCHHLHPNIQHPLPSCSSFPPGHNLLPPLSSHPRSLQLFKQQPARRTLHAAIPNERPAPC
jgi:hypothetical protein